MLEVLQTTTDSSLSDLLGYCPCLVLDPINQEKHGVASTVWSSI